MSDKFATYYNTNEKIKELSEYVHKNFHLIQTKMLSEMRRKLDIKPDLQNTEGYVSLLVSLYGQMINEVVYGLCGLCQSTKISPQKIVPVITLQLLLSLYNGKNPLKGKTRTDISETSKEERDLYYLQHIDELRKIVEALPK